MPVYAPILESFPAGMSPREGQRIALETVAANWDKADVFVINIPTGGGKTATGLTVAKWASKLKMKSFIAVPTNILVGQLQRDMPRLFALKKRHEHKCLRSTEQNPVNCQEWTNEHAAPCKGCPYTKSLRQCRVMPYQAGNYYTYLAHKLYMDVLIIDEAHVVLGLIKDLAAKKLWWHEYKFPRNVRDYRSLLRWTTEELEKIPAGVERLKAKRKKLEILHADLVSGAHRYLVERTHDDFRGRTEEVLKLLPIDTSAQPPILWPQGKVKKIVLMSATIGPKDVEQMGLADRRVCWVSMPSPIPPERRPVVVDRVFDVSYAAQGKDMDALCEHIAELAERHKGERGLIHCTYPMMREFERRLGQDPRFIFHNNADKMDRYKEFLEAGPAAVLVCAGLFEGVDLPGDLGRWQVVAKLPWPSLAEPAIRWLAQMDRERYVWDVAKMLMQATGRVVRGPTDWGVTYICDRSFRNISPEIFPSWFTHGLDAGKRVNFVPGVPFPIANGLVDDSDKLS